MENNNHFAYLLDYKKMFGFIEVHLVLNVCHNHVLSVKVLKPPHISGSQKPENNMPIIIVLISKSNKIISSEQEHKSRNVANK